MDGMTFRKIIGQGMLVLLFAQSALLSAGSFLMCLHGAGDVHLVEPSEDDDCCHEPSESISTASHMCEGCTDLEFSRSDLLMWRETQRSVPQVLMLPQVSAYVEAQPVGHTAYEATHPTRAPPLAESMARLHTRTIRLLV